MCFCIVEEREDVVSAGDEGVSDVGEVRAGEIVDDFAIDGDFFESVVDDTAQRHFIAVIG